jgi:hypothetical protein
VALPVGAKRVIAPALLGVGEHVVGLVDLLELGRRALGDVGVILPGKLPEGRLDGLVVGGSLHAEDLVVVLVFHVFRHGCDAPGTPARRSAASHEV